MQCRGSSEEGRGTAGTHPGPGGEIGGVTSRGEEARLRAAHPRVGEKGARSPRGWAPLRAKSETEGEEN